MMMNLGMNIDDLFSSCSRRGGTTNPTSFNLCEAKDKKNESAQHGKGGSGLDGDVDEDDVDEGFQLISPVLEAVQDPEFLLTVGGHGLDGVFVELSPFIASGEPRFDRFIHALHQARQQSNTARACQVQLVFHGTREMNIANILQHGLDPTRRKGQAYGPGEYFATDPGPSVSYCKGGHKMLIFAVIVEPDNFKNKEMYVVVPDNDRQLPLAVLGFSEVSPDVLKKSQQHRNALLRLGREAAEKKAHAEEARYKAKVIQLVIHNELLSASDFYIKAMKKSTEGSLPPSWAAELVPFVCDVLRDDENFIQELFPGLPQRKDGANSSKTVELYDEEAASAAAALEQAKKGSNQANPSNTKEPRISHGTFQEARRAKIIRDQKWEPLSFSSSDQKANPQQGNIKNVKNNDDDKNNDTIDELIVAAFSTGKNTTTTPMLRTLESKRIKLNESNAAEKVDDQEDDDNPYLQLYNLLQNS